MDIYIKPVKKYKLEAKNKIYVRDIADIYAEHCIMQSVKGMMLMEINEQQKNNYIISAIDIISVINKELPGAKVVIVGEADTIVEYSPVSKKDNPYIKWAKIFFICVVLAAGSSTAIMSFHTDAQIPVIFRNYYYMVFQKTVENPALIEIPYSIGLAFGIIVFFNHFGGNKITDDPTPIEVEMASYEKIVSETKIDLLAAQKAEDKKNDGSS